MFSGIVYRKRNKQLAFPLLSKRARKKPGKAIYNASPEIFN